MFDFRPANVVRMPEGPVVPIDYFVSRVRPEHVHTLMGLRRTEI